VRLTDACNPSKRRSSAGHLIPAATQRKAEGPVAQFVRFSSRLRFVPLRIKADPEAVAPDRVHKRNLASGKFA